MRCIPRPVAAGLAIILAALAPAAADEPFASVDLVWARPATEDGAPRPCARLLVLNLPRDWMVGDAAVAVFAAADAEAAIRTIVRALVPELAAVLEVPSRVVDECRTPPAGPVAEVLGVVRALQVDAGAGLIVAIGIGAAGPAVLAATREEVARRYLGPDGPRLAAAIALGGDGPAAYAIGALPGALGWEMRAPLLCAALASATSEVRPGACLTGLGIDQPMARSDQRMRR
ncbi:hypothetical protein AAFN86_14355 [Roseomonas sp. CAU 1739]|uniref:hypothetical protein n=1 Tax=Roseomonas sp. CAU 1739 TaxID=3140364 RepID=UPI00325B3BA6